MRSHQGSLGVAAEEGRVMVTKHREKVMIAGYNGGIVTDGRLTEKDRAEVEDSLKRLSNEWRFNGGIVRLEDEHTILVEVKVPLTPEQYGAVHNMLDDESNRIEVEQMEGAAISSS
jgi:hypothetical protein